MTWSWFVLGAGVAGTLLSGCSSTLKLPRGPDIYSMSMRPGAPVILVARPVDQRTDKKRVGTIGGLGLNLKDDPSELVAREVVSALHERGFNGTIGHVASDNPAAFSQAGSQTLARGVLALSVESISVKSFDALMDPPTASVTLKGTLHDGQGVVVSGTTVTGSVQHRIGFMVEQAAAELIAEAIHDAAQRLVAQEPLAGSLKRL